MKHKAKSTQFFLLLSIVFVLIGIILSIFGFAGMTLVIPILSWILLFIALVCFIIAGILFLMRRKVKVEVNIKD